LSKVAILLLYFVGFWEIVKCWYILNLLEPKMRTSKIQCEKSKDAFWKLKCASLGDKFNETQW